MLPLTFPNKNSILMIRWIWASIYCFLEIFLYNHRMEKEKKKNISEYKNIQDFIKNSVVYGALERLKDK